MRLLTVFTALALATASMAQETGSIINKIGDLGKAAAVQGKASGARSTASYGSSVRIVLAKESTIQPGSFKDYGEVPADFNGANDISVSISAPNSNLTGTTIVVAWAAPEEYFVATDLIKGTTLSSREQGGARVPVYGSALRIFVANDGTAPITIRQLAVYAFIH